VNQLGLALVLRPQNYILRSQQALNSTAAGVANYKCKNDKIRTYVVDVMSWYKIMSFSLFADPALVNLNLMLLMLN